MCFTKQLHESVLLPLFNSIFQLPGLFDGCQFYFSGEFCPPHPSKEHLVQMVKYGGGKILSREPKPDIDESLCLPTTRESNKAPNPAVTLAPIAYHANPSSKQYRCTQYVIYDSLAEKKPNIRNTDSVCSMPSPWLMDCASNFAIIDLEWVVLVNLSSSFMMHWMSWPFAP